MVYGDPLWQHLHAMQHRRPAPPPSVTELSIELTAQELMDPTSTAAGAGAAGMIADIGMIEVTDICDVDPALRTGSFAANSAAPIDQGDSVEIELTAEQMETLLGDR